MSIDIKIESAKTLKPKPATHDLGFGKYFTDHMFIADFSEAKGWFDPRIVAYQPLSLDPGASVLHYGQALFEGMKAFKGVDGKTRLFRPEMNWKRLQEGAARLCMKAPNWDLFFQGILNFVKIEETWIPTEPTTSLYLRPTLIGTEAFLGVRPSEQYLFYIIGSPVGAYYSQPDLGIQAVKIWVEMNDSRCAPGGIGAVKAGGNYASSLRAATAARKQGYAQVLWLDAGEKKYIEEVGTMNVFFKIADEVITPPLSGTILPGVMRNSIIELMNSMGLSVTERKISLEEVMTAHQNGILQEVFGTGTAASVSPVGVLGLNNKTLTIQNGNPGPLAQKLYQTVTDIQYARIPDHMNWMTTAN